jgi:hypothetical protein
MLAGPMPRHTKRLSSASLDQLTGVGVGLGVGVEASMRAGDGLCEADGVWEGTGPSARDANTPKLIANSTSPPIAARSPAKSRAERRISLIGGILSIELLVRNYSAVKLAFEEDLVKNY